MTVLINPTRAERPIHEVENAIEFAGALEQAETIDGRSKRLQVIICVRNDETEKWRDLPDPYWTGTKDQGLKVPSRDELLAVCRSERVRFAKWTARFTA